MGGKIVKTQKSITQDEGQKYKNKCVQQDQSKQNALTTPSRGRNNATKDQISFIPLSLDEQTPFTILPIRDSH